MEINIQIKNVQKPEDVLNAFAAISSASGGRDRGIASGGRERGRSRPPIQRQAECLRSDQQCIRRERSRHCFRRARTWKKQTTDPTASNEDDGGNQTVAEFDFVATGADCTTASSSSRQRTFVHRGRHCWRSVKRRATENETATIFGLPETGKAACRTHDVAKAVQPLHRDLHPHGNPSPLPTTLRPRLPPGHCLSGRKHRRHLSPDPPAHRDPEHRKGPAQQEEHRRRILQPSKTSLSMDQNSRTANIHISNTSGIQTPYTSNVQISYTSGIQISYTSGNSSSIGILIQGSEIDEYNISRVIYNSARSAKNLAAIVVNGKAWGSLRKQLGGSYVTARVATQEDDVLKDTNGKAHFVSRNKYSFDSLAFEQLAHAPTTAAALISQFQRAANIEPRGRQILM
eukprot:s2433_g20.t1